MSDHVVAVRVWSIIPAAGQSRRMGRTKQTLSYGSSTMVSAITQTVLAAGVERVVVVTRSELRDHLQLPEDDRVEIAINDDAGSEMIDSIRIGLATLEGASNASGGEPPGVLVVPGDMPKVTAACCRACIAAFRKDADRIVIATYQGRRGHPVVFPLSLRASVDALTGGLRELAAAHPDLVQEVETDDHGATMDVNTPDDFQRL